MKISSQVQRITVLSIIFSITLPLAYAVGTMDNAMGDGSSSSPQWIGAIKKEDAHIPEGRNYHALAVTSEAAKKWQQTHPLSKRSIYLRKPFEPHGKVKSAIIMICGLGHYELSLNGEKVGDDQFAPLWSDYDKTVYYNT
jgi:hypothetical protein